MTDLINYSSKKKKILFEQKFIFIICHCKFNIDNVNLEMYGNEENGTSRNGL